MFKQIMVFCEALQKLDLGRLERLISLGAVPNSIVISNLKSLAEVGTLQSFEIFKFILSKVDKNRVNLVDLIARSTMYDEVPIECFEEGLRHLPSYDYNDFLLYLLLNHRDYLSENFKCKLRTLVDAGATLNSSNIAYLVGDDDCSTKDFTLPDKIDFLMQLGIRVPSEFDQLKERPSFKIYEILRRYHD